MPPRGPLKLNLSEEYETRCHRWLVEASRDAEQAVAERDRDLAFYDDLARQRGAVKMRGPWRNSCQLEDPLIPEQRTQLRAKLTPALQRDLLVQVDAIDPEDAESAKRVESWFAFVSSEEELPARYDGFIANALRDPTAVLAVGWQQEYKQERGVSYWDGKTTDDFGQPFLVPEEGKDEGEDYQEVPTLREEVESQKAVYEVIDLADFYLYPPKQQRVEKALGVFVRRLYSECELLDGIEEYGYDKAAVMRLIRMGPTLTQGSDGIVNRTAVSTTDTNDEVVRMGIDSDERTTPNMGKSDRLDRIEGINTTLRNREDGLYECREWWGYLPKLRDSEGEPLLPEHLFRDRVRALFCPQYEICFLLDFAPDPECPYFSASMIEDEGRFLGTGLVQLLQSGGLAATFLTRWTLDSMQLEMTPAFVMPEEDYADNGSFALYPGAKFTESQPNAVRPLQTASKSEMGFTGLAHILNRFKSLSAAEGIGELQPKVRKNGEMQNILQTADAKYGLYGYFLYAPLAKIAARRIALELRHNPNFAATLQTQNGEITVTADDLRKRFRFSPIQISADSNPETRAGRTQQKLAVQATYIQGVQAFPQWAVEIWHGARQALLDLEERNPSAWIGDEAKAQAIAFPYTPEGQQQQAQMAQQAIAGATGGGMPPQGGGTLQPLAQSTLLPHLAAPPLLPTP